MSSGKIPPTSARDMVGIASRSPGPDTLNRPAIAVAENEPAVDLQMIANLHEEGDDLLVDLIELFSSEAPRQLTRIRDSLVAGDWQIVRIAAHTLRGTASNFGAYVMRDLAAKIETAAYPAETDEVVHLLEQLGTQYERVRGALAEAKAKLAADSTST
jgi:HPt (histidine-containing phosphotransfer) domain-containing protein